MKNTPRRLNTAQIGRSTVFVQALRKWFRSSLPSRAILIVLASATVAKAAPSISSVSAISAGPSVTVVFTEAVNATALVPSNYTLTGSLTVLGVVANNATTVTL